MVVGKQRRMKVLYRIFGGMLLAGYVFWALVWSYCLFRSRSRQVWSDCGCFVLNLLKVLVFIWWMVREVINSVEKSKYGVMVLKWYLLIVKFINYYLKCAIKIKWVILMFKILSVNNDYLVLWIFVCLKIQIHYLGY